MMSNEKLLAGVLAGIAISATTAILFIACRQRRIAEKGSNKQELAAQANQLIINITKRFEAMKEEADRAVQRTKAEAHFSKRAKLGLI